MPIIAALMLPSMVLTPLNGAHLAACLPEPVRIGTGQRSLGSCGAARRLGGPGDRRRPKAAKLAPNAALRMDDRRAGRPLAPRSKAGYIIVIRTFFLVSIGRRNATLD